ncbi:unnamed protein product [Rotaria sp. Silwood2]|nr:unnamed protein product [Rotaria sp. Silwood2]
MNHWLILTAILLSFTVVQGLQYSLFGRCSYTGDPHLCPFPSSISSGSNMYFCQHVGWEILLQNQWVLIVVKVGPSPFVIVDFIIIFLDGTGGLKCILFGGLGLLTCPLSSSIISITNVGGTAWTHWYPSAQFLNIQISSYPWILGTRYDFVIRETYALIQQSTGICIKFNCPLEGIIVAPAPIIIKICNIYISSAQQRLIGRVDERTVGFVRIACQNDLQLSFNLKLAQSAVALLIHISLDRINDEKYQDIAAKAEENIRAALLVANRLVASLIKNEGTCSQQRRCLSIDD